jgi:hypothetical protein
VCGLSVSSLAGLTRWTNLDRKPGGRNRFASAAGATARPGQAGSFTEDIPAVMAGGGFQHKMPRSIASEGSDDVEQMMFNVSFRDAEQGGEFIRRT